MNELIRLNKFISDNISCSRHDADICIEEGRVKVNGQKPTVGMKIDPYSDIIVVDGRRIENKDDKVYIVLNKPEGYSSSTDSGINNLPNLVRYKERLFNIFRLNKEHEGLILLTNDGNLAQHISRFVNDINKEYLVSFNRKVSSSDLENIHKEIKKAGFNSSFSLRKLSDYSLIVISKEDIIDAFLKICRDLNLIEVLCRRNEICGINIKDVEVGEWRFILPNELISLNSHIRTNVAPKSSPVKKERLKEVRMPNWQAELKRNKELKMAEAMQNPKSKLLRSGRKQSNSKTSVKTETANKESLRANKNSNQKPKTKNAGMRLEDAIKNPRIIESVRKNKSSFTDKRSRKR